MRKVTIIVTFLFLIFGSIQAQEMDKQAKIESAMSAAPNSISGNATIKDWPTDNNEEMVVLREGTNQFTCLPDRPDTPGNDPMCLDDPWLEWANAWTNKKEFSTDKMGFGYMLQGGTPESNIDPYANSPTSDNEWMEESVPHLMILVPDNSLLSGLPTSPEGGGPWVMWQNTEYVHIMVPMPKHNPSTQQASN